MYRLLRLLRARDAALHRLVRGRGRLRLPLLLSRNAALIRDAALLRNATLPRVWARDALLPPAP